MHLNTGLIFSPEMSGFLCIVTLDLIVHYLSHGIGCGMVILEGKGRDCLSAVHIRFLRNEKFLILLNLDLYYDT